MLNPYIKHAFNRAAHSYDEHCQLQKQTGTTLLALSKKYAKEASTIIDIGCGTGIHTEQLAKMFPNSALYALDFSNKLLQKASSRLASYQTTFIEEDFDHWQWNQAPFNIIYSNLALHWSSHFSITIKKLLSMLNESGILVFSIPLAGTLDELRTKFFLRNFQSMQEVLHAITPHQHLFHTQEIITQHYPDSFSALRSIKSVGANFVKPSHQRGLRGKSSLNKFAINQLTYVIGYFVITRPES